MIISCCNLPSGIAFIIPLMNSLMFLFCVSSHLFSLGKERVMENIKQAKAQNALMRNSFNPPPRARSEAPAASATS